MIVLKYHANKGDKDMILSVSYREWYSTTFITTHYSILNSTDNTVQFNDLRNLLGSMFLLDKAIMYVIIHCF